MNIYKQRLLNAARAVRESPAPHRFNMDYYLHADGTPGCVIGHYCARTDLQDAYRTTFGGHIIATSLNDDPLKHFGITGAEHNLLFSGRGCCGAQTVEQAARYIEAFAEHKYPGDEPRLDAAFVKFREALTEEETV